MRDRFKQTLDEDAGRGVRGGVQPRREETLAAVRARDREPLRPAMSRIEDYGLIGDLQTAALVDRRGSIDWLCFPRFDSGACFAALLGDEDNGRWLLAPVDGGTPTRRYLHDTLVLETTWETDDGAVRVLDFMPPREEAPDVVRIVEGVRGSVRMRSELVDPLRLRPHRPVGAHVDGTRLAVAGADALGVPHAGRHARRGHADDLGVHRRRGRARPVRAHVVPVARGIRRSRSTRSARSPTRRASGASGTGGAPDSLPDEWRDVVRPLADGAEGAHVRADRRDRRRPDDVAAGVDRRRPQLGLPLLLAARRDADAARAAQRRPRRRGGALAAVAAARGRRRPGRPPDHVRRRRRAAADASSSCRGWPATRARPRSASATPRASSSRSTSTAR